MLAEDSVRSAELEKLKVKARVCTVPVRGSTMSSCGESTLKLPHCEQTGHEIGSWIEL
jgi:hypothetical protein